MKIKGKVGWVSVAVCLSFLGVFLFIFTLEPVAAAEEKVVKLGCNMALSGATAFWGSGYTNAIKLAAKQINASGGFSVKGERYKWDVVACDNKYNISEVVSCANKLIYEDKAKYMAILGGAPGIAIAPITNKEKVLQVMWAGGGKALTNPNNPLVFRHSPVDVVALWTGIYKWFMEKEKIKTVATINPDDESGYSVGEGCKEAANTNGLKTVATEYFPRATIDFYPILTRIISKNPDCIDLGYCGFRDVATIAKQLYELKYKGVVILYSVDLTKADTMIGREALEGRYSNLTLVEMITPEQKKYYKEYVAEYGEWNEQSLLGYDFPFTLTECIVEGQTFDPVKIAQIMQDKEIPYLYGKGRYGMEKTFGIKRQGLYPTPFAQFKNGKWHQVAFIEPVVPR